MGNNRSSLARSVVLSLCISSAIANDVFDVIIVGSGPGGLVAAEYLSRDSSVSVLVLEAGVPSLRESGGDNIPAYIRPDEWTVFDIPGEYTNTAFPGDNNGRYRIDWVASPGPLYLGKVVGGSSSLNGMLYFHTADSYVEEANWPYDTDTVNANFDEIEKSFGSTNQPSPDGQWYLQEAYNIVGNALGANGFREVDVNEARNDKSQSYGHPPFTIKDGLRDSPAKTFLGEANKRGNFKIVTSAMVSHIVQRQGVATGVVYSSGGQSIAVDLSARGAVVMGAGAVSTPKVLIQSGIGPRDQLDLLANNGNFPGIGNDASKWVVNENVGDHLFDTIQTLTTYKHPDMINFAHGSSPQWAIDQYVSQNHAGPWASPDPVVVGYEYTGENQFQVTGYCHSFNWGSSDRTEYGIALYLNNPKGRTRCEFKADGSYHFNLNGGLYSHPDDAAAIHNYFGKLQVYLEGAGSTFVNQHEAQGANHYGGSCIPSNDANDGSRCADGTFKVVGTSNIFVADASLMKEGTVNPYAFVMQIGRQAGLNVEQFLAAGGDGPIPATCAAIEDNTDYFGNDIGSTTRASAEECCNDCAATANCNLYVWFQGTCWLKSAAGPKSAQPGRRAALLERTTPPSTCSRFEDNTDYGGNDIGSTDRASAEECCDDCANTDGCTLFVWAQGTCWLKSSAGDASDAPGAKAGFMNAP
ncbi:Aste57867_8278 [Aphanomyces stellatus]|uniref:Aste57867_8278 protein n=1 Tax=Aphanomyces stellatus TaxID=120398 RepID=A0A485KJX9_9STRA|nr:hypothetical protein As57867_008247 [Aphanomyces stellatus]VFT85165.1 Aste57867_8278 [Aphanomyces stellatus]